VRGESLTQTLRLTILTPEKVILQADAVRKVRLRLADGAWLSVYPRHAPLIAEVAPGVILYDAAEGNGAVSVGSGFLQVEPDCVLVLTDQTDSSTGEGIPGADADQVGFERQAHELFQALRMQRDDDVAFRAIDDVLEGA
jgi:F0F1-type ATP synthase epsilon subunit